MELSDREYTHYLWHNGNLGANTLSKLELHGIIPRHTDEIATQMILPKIFYKNLANRKFDDAVDQLRLEIVNIFGGVYVGNGIKQVELAFYL